MIRVVIDPSVFVSALIGQRGSAPDRVVRAFVDDKIEVVVCPLLLAELERVLARPKFRRYIDARVVGEYVARIKRHATAAIDPTDVPPLTRDPDDDYLVALASREQVDALVTLDRDLLDAALATPPVWTPRQLADAVVE